MNKTRCDAEKASVQVAELKMEATELHHQLSQATTKKEKADAVLED